MQLTFSDLSGRHCMSTYRNKKCAIQQCQSIKKIKEIFILDESKNVIFVWGSDVVDI